LKTLADNWNKQHKNPFEHSDGRVFFMEDIVLFWGWTRWIFGHSLPEEWTGNWWSSKFEWKSTRKLSVSMKLFQKTFAFLEMMLKNFRKFSNLFPFSLTSAFQNSVQPSNLDNEGKCKYFVECFLDDPEIFSPRKLKKNQKIKFSMSWQNENFKKLFVQRKNKRKIDCKRCQILLHFLASFFLLLVRKHDVFCYSFRFIMAHNELSWFFEEIGGKKNGILSGSLMGVRLSNWDFHWISKFSQKKSQYKSVPQKTTDCLEILIFLHI
jgi:hypothetical protein